MDDFFVQLLAEDGLDFRCFSSLYFIEVFRGIVCQAASYLFAFGVNHKHNVALVKTTADFTYS